MYVHKTLHMHVCMCDSNCVVYKAHLVHKHTIVLYTKHTQIATFKSIPIIYGRILYLI